MVYRHPGLYRTLFLVFLLITIVLILTSLSPALPVAWQSATLIISLFFLVISLSYFSLSNQENKG